MKLKRCYACQKEKSVDEFYKLKQSKDGLLYRCKACERLYANKYRSTTKYREYAKEYARRYYLKNKEVILEKQRRYSGERLERRRKQVLNSVKKRMARKALLQSDLTEEQWEETLKNCNYRCVYCGKPWEHQDHFVPISKGGGYTINNIVPSCKSCNLSKKDKGPFDFIKSTILFRDAV